MKSAITNSRPTIVWFRNDLRVLDHEPLARACQSGRPVLPVYCFDPRHFTNLPLTGLPKTGPYRTKFLIESVTTLQKQLRALDSDLIINVGRPEEVLPSLAARFNAEAILASKESTSEETLVERQLETALKSTSVRLHLLWTQTMIHIDDLPFQLSQLPRVFTQFRRLVEKDLSVRPVFPAPQRVPLPPTYVRESEALDTVAAKLGVNVHTVVDSRSAFPFTGGEESALRRLDDYFFERRLLSTYKETRNGMIGADYSSKFSPWLANGTLSAKHVFHEVRRFERECGSNESTYWLIFELLWRDYFRFVAHAHGNTIFRLYGFDKERKTSWTRDAAVFQRWLQGKTRKPFVDANMIELTTTGFMSNRGRQNVASFLTKDLSVDWRMGAEAFESYLVDHDVCSNYCNWQYIAGVGLDPRQGRRFNIEKQAQDYDPQGKFVRLWLTKQEQRT